MAYGPPPQQPGAWQQQPQNQPWQQSGRDWQQPSPQSWQQPPAGQPGPGQPGSGQPGPGQAGLGQSGFGQPGGQAWQQQQPPAGAVQSGWQSAPPAAAPPTTAPPEPEHYGEIGYDEMTWALMAYIGQFLVSVIAPAVVYLGKARHPFVRRHAAQGLNMGIASAAVWALGGLISLMFPAILWLLVLFSGVVMGFLVYAARAANRGEFRQVPVFIAWPLIK
ncbi:DUF4870 domain-containing protein [Actinomadura harenae]|uniref:DUF4870 domain-containing protein n=1 Tax=Actinomadura harenae TaxID=2483351 RepID=A0A3M2MBF8_9ACTN|nr:DUF4870 domain-containing protein [Actinomadura harenae]RMI47124.1 DUF4870 domain-containing protein [Actinomadura harenae]